MIKPTRRVSDLVPREGQSRGDNILSLTGKSDNHHGLPHQTKGSQEEGHSKSHSHGSTLPAMGAIPPHCPIQCTEDPGSPPPQPHTWR